MSGPAKPELDTEFQIQTRRYQIEREGKPSLGLPAALSLGCRRLVFFCRGVFLACVHPCIHQDPQLSSAELLLVQSPAALFMDLLHSTGAILHSEGSETLERVVL